MSPQKNPLPSPPEYESYAKSKPTFGGKALTDDAEQVGLDAQTRQRSSHGCVGHLVNTGGMLRMRAEKFCTFSYIYIMWTHILSRLIGSQLTLGEKDAGDTGGEPRQRLAVGHRCTTVFNLLVENALFVPKYSAADKHKKQPWLPVILRTEVAAYYNPTLHS